MQLAGDRGQRTEDGEQKSEDKGQRAAGRRGDSEKRRDGEVIRY